MPGYTKSNLQRFNHPIPNKRQDSSLTHTPPNYGAKLKYTKEPDTQKPLNDEERKFIQRFSGTLLYLTHAVEINLLTSISAITSQQSKLTSTTMKITLQIIDYVATQEESVLIYSRSQMILATHRDAGHPKAPEACIRDGGKFSCQKHNIPTKQRCHTHHCTNNQEFHVIISRS